VAPLRVATRGSALARWQTDFVVSLLGVAVEVVVVETTGDRRRDVPIAELGRGVFVKEVQAAVLDGRADFAVHSAKDLPSSPALNPEGLTIAAVPRREDPRDALVGTPLDALAPGALVATGAVRRRAQLAARRPDLTFAGLRGNVDTRLAKAGDYDAIVVALAALKRLGRDDVVAEILEASVMLPQVAQGALAVECRVDDAATRRALAAVEDALARTAVDAERAFLATLGGGCDLPAGAHATVAPDGIITLTGMLCTADGRRVVRHTATGSQPAAVGAAVATAVLPLLVAESGQPA
jgi:hydroxymethylbilane synthase